MNDEMEDAYPDVAHKAAQTLDRAMDVLRVVAATRAAGASLSDVVRISGLTKPTARRLLISLIENGLVEQNSVDRRYYIGAGTFALGLLASSRFGIERLAVDSLQRLAKRCGDAALLSIQSGWHTLCLAREEGDFPLRSQVLKPGDRHPLGAGAAGLALLAELPDDMVEVALATNDGILRHGYPGLKLDVLRQDVKVTRERGYALNAGMVVQGSWGVAVAVQDARGGMPVALTIAGIESRFQGGRLEQLVEMLQEEKQKLQAQIQRSGNAPSQANKANGKLHPVKSS
jgi:DNA-binding IclR family transcriptional regulator